MDPSGFNMPERMEEEFSLDSEPVQLQPFIHQVGGHTCVLRFNETTLCKPLIPRELYFYETVPRELQEFVPEYRGVIEVQLHEDSDGYITLMGYPPSVDASEKLSESQHSSPKDLIWARSPASSGSGSETDNTASPVHKTKKKYQTSPESCSIRLLSSGNIEVSTQTDKVFHSPDPKSGFKTAESLNPWSLKCQKKQLAKMRKNNQDSDHYKFILLENVAAKFSFPCILDLKMGTRQHGDDAPETKKLSQTRKCKNTTSVAIGLRLCGMQVYQLNTGRFVCHNKYFGRSLSVEGFKDSLYQFLNNGQELRVDLIGTIVQQLKCLGSIIHKQDSFRFYSSSLLIMYDGQEKSMKDALNQDNLHDSEIMSKQTGGVLAPENYSANKSTVLSSEKSEFQGEKPHVLSSSHTEYSEERTSEFAYSQNEFSGENKSIISSQTECIGQENRTTSLTDFRRDSAQVEIRMIDFAHSTHPGFREDTAIHTGPDQGYLFGLENLIKMFQEISDNHKCKSHTNL
ncbi:hypothetical protein CHS0354_022124 [Potamilus streckersoni]|uniref:Kinase n=1 Tax=Potamilus streckersoni TaxID=2493646 RepID=A0AAE0VI35_9BIVA|nr:hypothetical protein CHS0354_022124 [Potamilus streckersoni]